MKEKVTIALAVATLKMIDLLMRIPREARQQRHNSIADKIRHGELKCQRERTVKGQL